MNAVEAVQHMNTVATLGFCILYSHWSFRLGVLAAIFIWVFGLPLFYFTNLMTIPGVTKEEMNSAKKASIFTAWIWVLFFVGMWSENNSLMIMSVALLILLAAFCISFIRKWNKEHVHREGEGQ